MLSDVLYRAVVQSLKYIRGSALDREIVQAHVYAAERQLPEITRLSDCITRFYQNAERDASVDQLKRKLHFTGSSNHGEQDFRCAGTNRVVDFSANISTISINSTEHRSRRGSAYAF